MSHGLRASLVVALALLGGLAIVHAASDAGAPPKVAFDGAIPSIEPGGGAELLDAVTYTPPIHVERPSRLTIAVERAERRGYAAVEYALVDLETAQVREGALEPSPAGTAILDRVEPGTYAVRFVAVWDRRGTLEHVEPPSAFRAWVAVGGRPPWEPYLLAAVLVAPALASFVVALRRGGFAAPRGRV